MTSIYIRGNFLDKQHCFYNYNCLNLIIIIIIIISMEILYMTIILNTDYTFKLNIIININKL